MDGEKVCRRFLERYYGLSFINTKPFWLINPNTMKHMEIDCYSEELGIGIEYDGPFHKGRQQDETRLRINSAKNTGLFLSVLSTRKVRMR